MFVTTKSLENKYIMSLHRDKLKGKRESKKEREIQFYIVSRCKQLINSSSWCHNSIILAPFLSKIRRKIIKQVTKILFQSVSMLRWRQKSKESTETQVHHLSLDLPKKRPRASSIRISIDYILNLYMRSMYSSKALLQSTSVYYYFIIPEVTVVAE